MLVTEPTVASTTSTGVHGEMEGRQSVPELRPSEGSKKFSVTEYRSERGDSVTVTDLMLL